VNNLTFYSKPNNFCYSLTKFCFVQRIFSQNSQKSSKAAFSISNSKGETKRVSEKAKEKKTVDNQPNNALLLQ
jgi:hypothetical protein